MRIIFMGTPDFAVPSLNVLVENGYDVAAVVTAPDRRAGRGQQLRASPVKAAAQQHGIAVLQPEKLRQPEFVERLQALAPDLMVVVAFRMLPEVVWSVPKQGTFNLHASLLPDYRGAAPINWAIINGETRSGATTFLIDHQIDTGNVLLRKEVDIPPHWNAGDLHDHLMSIGANLVLQTVQGLEASRLTPQPQDPKAAQHHAPKIFKEDCRIDWSRSAEELFNFVRGLAPYPTAWTTLRGQRLKVYAVSSTEIDGTALPGTTRQVGEGLVVATGDGWLTLQEIQPAGKKPMSVAAFLRGYQGEWQETVLGE